MKVHIANYEPGRIGGGWTFAKNIYSAFNASYDEADIYFICGATQASHDDVRQAKADGKKIVLRIDNAVRNSRNRGTGMTRMKAFADQADLVIYQSKWAKNLLKPFLGKDGAVILNGVDTTQYNSDNRNPDEDTCLYVRSSRDEGKGWLCAWYWFVNNKGRLEIAGKFSRENMEYNFDFYNNERYIFTGEHQNMVDVYKRNKFFLYTYLNDACSNTLLEARASGCQIIDVYGMLQTGGAPEIMACKDISLERMIKEYQTCLAVIA